METLDLVVKRHKPEPTPKALTVTSPYLRTLGVVPFHRLCGMLVAADDVPLSGVQLCLIDNTGRLSEAELQETAEEIAWRINAHA